MVVFQDLAQKCHQGHVSVEHAVILTSPELLMPSCLEEGLNEASHCLDFDMYSRSVHDQLLGL